MTSVHISACLKLLKHSFLSPLLGTVAHATSVLLHALIQQTHGNPVIVHLDQNMKNENYVHSWVYSLKDTWNTEAREIRVRGLSGCFKGSWRDWNCTRLYPRLCWAGFQLLAQEKIAAVILFYIFSWTLSIFINFSIYLVSEFLYVSFRAIFCIIDPGYQLIWMTCPPSLD